VSDKKKTERGGGGEDRAGKNSSGLKTTWEGPLHQKGGRTKTEAFWGGRWLIVEAKRTVPSKMGKMGDKAVDLGPRDGGDAPGSTKGQRGQ